MIKILLLGLFTASAWLVLAREKPQGAEVPLPSSGVVPARAAESRNSLQASIDRMLQYNAQRASWVSEQTRILAARGKEPGTAGFSLLRPGVGSDVLNPARASSFMLTSKYAFWTVSRGQQNTTYTVVPQTPSGTIGWPPTQVSLQRIFDNGWLSSATSVPEANGTSYRLEIKFGTPGIQRLATLIGLPPPQIQYVDWFGEQKAAGQAPTEMKAVLVADNTAYLPVSLTDIVNNNVVNQSVVVATGLTQAMASGFVSKLGF